MINKRIAIAGAGVGLGVLVAVAAALFIWFSANTPSVEAQEPNSMGARLDQVIDVLNNGKTCQTAEMAIDRGMEILYGGMRVLPSVGVPDSEKAHQRISDAELKMARALEKYAKDGKCKEETGSLPATSSSPCWTRPQATRILPSGPRPLATRILPTTSPMPLMTPVNPMSRLVQ